MTDNFLKILLVIPLYNNAASVRSVVEKASATDFDVLVVDDGSTDESIQNLKGLRFNLVSHPWNTGKGTAIKTAAEWAEKNGFSHIITLDADGQHDPADAVAFAERLAKRPRSIIVGRRRFPKHGVPLSSRLGRLNSNFWLFVVCGFWLPDSQSGFRACPVEVVRSIPCAASRYDFEVEILFRAAWAGVVLESLPVSVVYNRETRGASHFRPLRDNMRCSLAFIKAIFRNMLPLPHKRLFPSGTNAGPSAKAAFSSVAGLFWGLLPPLGLHLPLVMLTARKMGLDGVASFKASCACVPPLASLACVGVGHLMRRGKLASALDKEIFSGFFGQLVLDFTLGFPVLFSLLAAAVLLRALAAGRTS